MTPKTKKGYEARILQIYLNSVGEGLHSIHFESFGIKQIAEIHRQELKKAYRRGFKQGFIQGKVWQMADELERKIKEA